MTSWLPSRAWTRPPAAFACSSRAISRSSEARMPAPRSQRSPVCTRIVLPPDQRRCSSISPVRCKIAAKLSTAPWTSAIATMRGPRSCAAARSGDSAGALRTTRAAAIAARFTRRRMRIDYLTNTAASVRFWTIRSIAFFISSRRLRIARIAPRSSHWPSAAVSVGSSRASIRSHSWRSMRVI